MGKMGYQLFLNDPRFVFHLTLNLARFLMSFYRSPVPYFHIFETVCSGSKNLCHYTVLAIQVVPHVATNLKATLSILKF